MTKKTLLRREGSFAKLPLALTGGFSLFLALDAGLLVMLAFTHFLENAAAGALPLEPFERTFQGLIFADTNLGHCYPSPRSIHGLRMITNQTGNHGLLYSQRLSESTFFQNTPDRLTIQEFRGTGTSGHPLAHPAAAEDMEVKMPDRLAGVRPAVGYQAVPAGQVFEGGNSADGAQAF